jgi:acetyl-CoA synthetase
VNPKRSEAHGRPCFPSLSDLPEVPDAVVVAIPAAGVPEVVDEAGALGCGGAVVYGAGFGEVASGVGHERRLAEAASRHSLPVCGPNGNGIVSLHARATLWGDTLRELTPGPVALVSQSGNVAVNALAARRGLRFHTVVSCGNSVMVDPADWLAALAQEQGVGSIALYLEADGDGAALCEALAVCAERGVGVAVLKVGSSAAGAAAAAAHTGAIAGDQRIFRALVEEAGAAWAADVHDLLELAKAMAVPGARAAAGGGLAILTCSGGDSALAADKCERLGLTLPPLAPATGERLRRLLPEAATVGNPLDYTALIWGEVERLRDIVVTVGEDPAIEQVLVFYDQAADVGAAERSWGAVREGIRLGAEHCPVPVMVSSTLPELLHEDAAVGFMDAGVPAVAGLRTGLACAAALSESPGDARRLRAIGEATSTAISVADNGTGWMSEHEVKELLRAGGLPVVEGRLVSGEDDAAAALSELGGRVALKLAGPSVRHKAELGALALDVSTEPEARAAHRRLLALGVADAGVLVERMAPAGAELLVAARSDGVVPCVVVGAGGIWTEALADAAVVPLPASPERVEQAIRGLRAAPLFTGGRGRPPLDIPAAARLASAAGELLLENRLELLELNPVLVHEHGVVVVDALAATR